MAQSLVKLTLESNQYEKGLKDAQRSLKDFTSAIGVNMKSLSGMALAAGAVTTAMKVAKDAFFKNEQQLDEWGRTVEASKSLYSGFLNAINNGDISGFLSNINNITEAARAAYDALDELGTFNAFNQIQTQKTRTGFTEAMAGYRMGEGSKEDVQKAAKAYQEELRTRQKKEEEAYRQAVRKIAAERGVSWGGLEQALTGKYGDYEKLKNTMPTGKQIKLLPGSAFTGPTAVEVPMAVTIQEKMGEALRKLNDTELQELQALGAQAYRTGEEIAQIDKQMARVLKGRQPGTGGGSGSGGGGRSRGGGNKTELTEMQQNQQTINELTQEYVRISDNANAETVKRQEEIRKEIQLLEQRNNLIKLYQEQAQGKLMGGEVQTEGLTGPNFRGLADLPSIGKGLSSETIEKVREAMKPENRAQESMARDLNKFTGYAEKTLGGVSSIVGGLSQLGVEIPKGLQDVLGGIQGITSIVTGIASLVAMIEALSTVQTTESTIKSIPVVGWALAGGGIIHAASGYEVPGNYYSGDQVPALLNSGELVLNKAQTNALSNALQGNGMQNLKLRTEVSGRNLIVVIENDLAARGKGQLATFKG
jgi:hypothetical protein